jgi:alkylation response protein AidB-like acyl-CoA dehydrogenase
MTFPYSDEQQELRRTVRAFLQRRSPEAEVRRLMASDEGYDPGVWRQMAGELGLQGLAIPESLGGGGFSFADQCVVLEEMGAGLLCAPYVASAVLAARALLECGDDAAQQDFLPDIAAGTLIATLGVAEDEGRWDESSIGTRATEHADGYTLSGTKSYVLDGVAAGIVLLAARTDAGVSLFAVSADAPGLRVSAMPTLDQTRKLARLELSQVPARLVGDEGQAWPGLARTLRVGAIALANESVGGAQAALDMAVEYAKVRIQYGRPIGSFQAIKHKCVDMWIEVESSRSAAQYAANAVDEGSEELVVLSSLAKAFVGDAYLRVALENIQVHGGIGFTWEHSAHLYLKRAMSTQAYLGDPPYHRAALAAQLGY